MKYRSLCWHSPTLLLVCLTTPAALAQDQPASDELSINHAECTFFGPNRERFLETGLHPLKRDRYPESFVTGEVPRKLAGGLSAQPLAARQSRTAIFDQIAQLGTID